MPKKIRRGIFETNSSSTHSISIIGGTYTKDKNLFGMPCVDIYPGEFGWGPEKYNSSPMKASYCLTYAKSKKDDYLLKMLEKVIKQETGCKHVEFLSLGGYNPWGYIDHQSKDVCEKAFSSEENLRNFIFNPASTLIIDNDNH